MPAVQCRRWCFTLANYTDAEVETLKASESFSYLVFGKEVAPSTGLPHLQGYLELPKKKSLGGVKGLLFPRVHLEIAKGTFLENKTYCSKGGDVFEKGSPIDESSNPWESARAAALAGKLDEIPAGMYIRNKRAFDQIAQEGVWKRASASRARIELVLRPWEVEIIDVLKGPVDDRKIYFVVDVAGGAGKSTFCRYVVQEFGSGVLHLKPAKGSDLAFILSEVPTILLLDCPRSNDVKIPWDFIEAVKDGHVVSTKYAGLVKDFPPPHVIIFTNQLGVFKDVGGSYLLSEDRIVEKVI